MTSPGVPSSPHLLSVESPPRPLSAPTSAFFPQAGLGLARCGSVAITCRHEEDASAQDDVVSSLVELAGRDAEPTHEKQNHTQDWEDA